MDPFVHPFLGAACIPIALMLAGAIAKANMSGRPMTLDDWVMGLDFCILACAIGIAKFIEWLNEAHEANWALSVAHGKELAFIFAVVVVSPFWAKVVEQIGWLVYPSQIRQADIASGKSVPWRYMISVNFAGAIPFVCGAAFLLR